MECRIVAQRIGTGQAFQSVLLDLLSDQSVRRCHALMAFVSLDALFRLGAESGGVFDRFALDPSKEFHWIVGIDAITTADSLACLRGIEDATGGRCSVRAFSSPSRGLFHPKFFLFERIDGTGTVIVGSNNLTIGGLENNFEVALILDCLSASELEMWHDLWQQAAAVEDALHVISDELISQVREQRRRENRGRRRGSPRRRRAPLVREAEPEDESGGLRVFLRHVAGGGGRTSQFHFSKWASQHFFHIDPGDTRPISLQCVRPGNVLGQMEPDRRLVYSDVNRNHKIEMQDLKRLPAGYKAPDKAVLVIQEVDVDRYRYMVLVQGEPGHRELSDHLNQIPRRGLALNEDILTVDDLLTVWPDYPV